MRGGFYGLVAVAAVVVGMLAPTLAGNEQVATIGPLLLPILLLLLVRRRLNVVYLSPLWIVALTLTGVGALSAVLGRRLANETGGGIQLSIPAMWADRTVALFGWSALWLTIGALIVVLPARARPARALSRGELKLPAKTPAARLLVLASAVPLLMTVGYAGSDILHRSQHLAGAGGSNIYALGQSLSLGAVAICGYVIGQKQRGRWLAWLLTGGYVLLAFSLSSRRLAIIPLILALGYLVGNQNARRPKLLIGAAAVASALLLPIPLYLRGLTTHGLFPYLDALGSFSYATTNWPAALNNILISYPITAATAYGVAPLPLHNLWVELNPLPGAWVGWYDISRGLTLNAWTPYSAVGELGNFGGVVMVAGWMFLGAVVGLLELRVRRHLSNGSPFVAVALLGLVGLFATQLLQYTLRPSFRMLVYAIALDVMVSVLPRRRPVATPVTPSPAPGRAAGTPPERSPGDRLRSGASRLSRPARQSYPIR